MTTKQQSKSLLVVNVDYQHRGQNSLSFSQTYITYTLLVFKLKQLNKRIKLN